MGSSVYTQIPRFTMARMIATLFFLVDVFLSAASDGPGGCPAWAEPHCPRGYAPADEKCGSEAFSEYGGTLTLVGCQRDAIPEPGEAWYRGTKVNVTINATGQCEDFCSNCSLGAPSSALGVLLNAHGDMRRHMRVVARRL